MYLLHGRINLFFVAGIDMFFPTIWSKNRLQTKTFRSFAKWHSFYFLSLPQSVYKTCRLQQDSNLDSHSEGEHADNKSTIHSSFYRQTVTVARIEPTTFRSRNVLTTTTALATLENDGHRISTMTLLSRWSIDQCWPELLRPYYCNSS